MTNHEENEKIFGEMWKENIIIAQEYAEKTDRQKRYGLLVRGWNFRTYPELLERAEKTADQLGMSKTEFIEFAFKAAFKLVEEGRYLVKD